MPYCFCTTSWLLCHVFPIIELTLFSPVISFFKKKINDKNYTNFFLTSPLYATQIDNIIFLLNYWLIVLSSSIISMISFTLILRNFSRLAYYFSLDIYIYIYIYIYSYFYSCGDEFQRKNILTWQLLQKPRIPLNWNMWSLKMCCKFTWEQRVSLNGSSISMAKEVFAWPGT